MVIWVPVAHTLRDDKGVGIHSLVDEGSHSFGALYPVLAKQGEVVTGSLSVGRPPPMPVVARQQNSPTSEHHLSAQLRQLVGKTTQRVRTPHVRQTRRSGHLSCVRQLTALILNRRTHTHTYGRDEGCARWSDSLPRSILLITCCKSGQTQGNNNNNQRCLNSVVLTGNGCMGALALIGELESLQHIINSHVIKTVLLV